MYEAEVTGEETTKFSAKEKDENGETRIIEGKTVHVKEQIPAYRGTGYKTLKIFLSTAKLSRLGFTPAPGQIVRLIYNRFGKVETMELVDIELRV